MYIMYQWYFESNEDRRDNDRVVIGFTTTYTISAYDR